MFSTPDHRNPQEYFNYQHQIHQYSHQFPVSPESLNQSDGNSPGSSSISPYVQSSSTPNMYTQPSNNNNMSNGNFSSFDSNSNNNNNNTSNDTHHSLNNNGQEVILSWEECEKNILASSTLMHNLDGMEGIATSNNMNAHPPNNYSNPSLNNFSSPGMNIGTPSDPIVLGSQRAAQHPIQQQNLHANGKTNNPNYSISYDDVPIKIEDNNFNNTYPHPQLTPPPLRNSANNKDINQTNFSTTSANNNNNNTSTTTNRRKRQARSMANSENGTKSKSSDEELGENGVPLDEEELIVKRKAQNRAAQRAFRERKEARVRELEEKLNASEKEKIRLASENERLRKENTVITTENQVLLATTAGGIGPGPAIEFIGPDGVSGDNPNNSNSAMMDRQNGSSTSPLVSTKMLINRTATHHHLAAQNNLKAYFPVHRFNFELLKDHDEEINLKTKGVRSLNEQNDSMKPPSYIVYEPYDGDTMLGAGAVWELIMEQPDSEDINVEFVMNFIKGKEHCDGFGPVFKKSDVLNGIAAARMNNGSSKME